MKSWNTEINQIHAENINRICKRFQFPANPPQQGADGALGPGGPSHVRVQNLQKPRQSSAENREKLPGKTVNPLKILK